MKKFTLFLLAALMIMVSCDNKNSYTLTGKLADNKYDGKIIYLQKFDENMEKRITTDSTTIENGSFTFKGLATEIPEFYFVSIDKNTHIPSLFIAEKGKIVMALDTAFTSTIKGTPINDGYQKYTDETNLFYQGSQELFKEYNALKEKGALSPEREKEIKDRSKASWEKNKKMTSDYIETIIATPIGKWLFAMNASSLDIDTQKKLLGMLPPEAKTKGRIAEAVKQVEALEATADGKQFTDITGMNLKGEKVSLSDYAGKGKVILIDFWASWCGPCIQSLPELTAIYKKYKGKGFEIVGVSLDGKKEDWAKASKEHGVVWPQMSNLKGWDEDAALVYGVRSIPQTVLIDKTGKIVKRNVAGESLATELDKLLK